MVAISAVICARNEAEKIEECLRSVRWAEEVVLFDMESSDATVERARPWVDRIVSLAPQPIVELVRQRMLQEATHDWVLIIDPDERVSAALAGQLRRLLEGERDFAAVNLPIRNYIFGRGMKSPGWYPDLHPRLVDRRRTTWPATIHATPQVAGTIIDLDPHAGGEILHYNYSSVSEFLQKMDRYTDLEASRLRENGRPFRWYKLLYHPLKEVWLRVIVRRGYRDGVAGVIFSLLMGVYYLVAYAKLWELERADEPAEAARATRLAAIEEQAQ